MIAKIGGGIAAAILVMLIGCAAVVGAILGVGGDDSTTTSATSSCLSLLETSSPPTTAPTQTDRTAPTQTDSMAPSATPTDSADPYGLDQCLSCLMSPAAQPSPTPSATAAGCPADAMLARAATWLTAWNGGPVPYLSSNATPDLFDGYRRDCSGYVSMALGLPGPGLNTREMADRFTPIDKADLQPGDLLINPAPDLAGHVVLFERWTDVSQTSYIGYEQTGDGGTHHRQIPYPYFGSYQMSPYAPVNRS